MDIASDDSTSPGSCGESVASDFAIFGGDSQIMQGVVGKVTLKVWLEDSRFRSSNVVNQEFVVYKNLLTAWR